MKNQEDSENLVRAVIFLFNNKCYPCIKDYHGKFPVIKQVERCSMDSLIKYVRLFFFRVQITPLNSFRHRDKLYIREVENFCK